VLLIIALLCIVTTVLFTLPRPEGHAWGRPDAHHLVFVDPRWVDDRGNWTARKLSQDAAEKLWGRVPSSLQDEPILISKTWAQRQAAQDVDGVFDTTWHTVTNAQLIYIDEIIHNTSRKVHEQFDLSDAA